MKSFDDKHCCPHCSKPLHQQPYLMSRHAREDVLTPTQIGWIICAVLALVLLVQVISPT